MTQQRHQNDEARQQRLSLTWSGTNEGPAAGDLADEAPRPAPARGLKIKLNKTTTVQPADTRAMDPPGKEEFANRPLTTSVHVPGKDEPATEMPPENLQAKIEQEITSSQAFMPPEFVDEMSPLPYEDEFDDEEAAAFALAAPVPVEVNEELTAASEETMANNTPEEPKRIKLSKLSPPKPQPAVTENEEAPQAEVHEAAPAPVPEPQQPAATTAPQVQAEAPPALEPDPVVAAGPPSEDEDGPRPALTVVGDEVHDTCTLKARPMNALNKSNRTCKLKPDTTSLNAAKLGEKLRGARQLAEYSVFEVAEKTRISSEYISALEQEDFDNLPLASIYVKSYLKTLASCYGIDADELIAEYEDRIGAVKNVDAKSKTQPKDENEGDAEADSRSLKKISLALAAVAAIAILIIGAGYFLKMNGPRVSPADFALISQEQLEESVLPEYFSVQKLKLPTENQASTRDF